LPAAGSYNEQYNSSSVETLPSIFLPSSLAVYRFVAGKVGRYDDHVKSLKLYQSLKSRFEKIKKK